MTATERLPIGERIKLAREAAGLRQEELGRQLGLTQAAIASYETGKREVHASTLEAIADVLGIEAACFYDPAWSRVALLKLQSVEQAEAILNASKGGNPPHEESVKEIIVTNDSGTDSPDGQTIVKWIAQPWQRSRELVAV